MAWTSALSLDRLLRDRQVVAKLGAKQVALFAAGDSIYACSNRCPHEGYPLREGTLDGGCVLTCNWHGWRFDLRTGDNLLQGDRLRIYPTKVVDGVVWVDLSDPPPAERQAGVLANLRNAFAEHEYDRMARDNDFLVIDATASIAEQQRLVRSVVLQGLDQYIRKPRIA